jgi:hypothetical protein
LHKFELHDDVYVGKDKADLLPLEELNSSQNAEEVALTLENRNIKTKDSTCSGRSLQHLVGECDNQLCTGREKCKEEA